MVGSRKYSGSSSFLNKFQRNSPGDEGGSEGDETPSAATAPEDILEVLAEGGDVPVSALEQRFGVAPGGLSEPIGLLVKLRLAERVAGPPPALRLTDVGLRAAGFSKIARK